MKKKRERKEFHKQALDEQIQDPESHGVRTMPHKKARRKAQKDEEAAEEGGIAPDQSTAILDLARKQQQEEEQDAARDASGADTGALTEAVNRAAREEASDSDVDGDWDVGDRELEDVEDFYADELEEVTEADEELFNAFMTKKNTESKGTSLLSDLIMSKLKEKETKAAKAKAAEEKGEATQGAKEKKVEGRGEPGEEQATPGPGSSAGMDETMEQIYVDVGILLKRYTTGKLPKAFKVVPHLLNWEDVVFTMDPEHWSPQATFAATKMFISQLNAKQAQRFLNIVLLNKVRDDIREHKRLHFALFQAVKKSLFKPGAFYKGFVLPLLKAGDCTLREAVIISSVLNRVSIPVDHSAAALLKMADMPYSGVTSFFMKTLLDKKYALPYRVVDALVDHYCSFKKEERQMPVIWHLSLLTFAQRYKHEIRSEDKEAIRELLKHQSHSGVTPEVLREVNHGRSRGEKVTAASELPVHARITSGAAEDVFNMAPVVVNESEF